jgi:hypothetical protein
MGAIKAVGLVLVILCAPFLDQAWRAWRWYFEYVPCPEGERIEFSRPFPRYGGVAYLADLPALEALSDDAGNPRRSPILLCEGPRQLGTGHGSPAAVAELGKGRFAHWGPHIIFTASDNSNPNANGRKYAAVKMDYVSAFTSHPVEIPTLAGLVISFITRK